MGLPLRPFTYWHVPRGSESTFDAWHLLAQKVGLTFDRWTIETRAEAVLFDAWHIAGELGRHEWDRFHVFASASARLKTVYDRHRLYGAAGKTLVDVYHILGDALKTVFDHYSIDEGRSWTKSLYDLYRLYQLAGYVIFSNEGDGGPVNYSESVGFTTATSWSTSGLSTSSHWRFGVRARNSMHCEQNTNVITACEIDAAGEEITGRPNAVLGLMAESAEGGHIRLRWSHDSSAEAVAATHFHIYEGDNPSSLAHVDSVSRTTGTVARYAWTGQALENGARRWLRVKAATADDVECLGAALVTAEADTVIPDQLESFSVEVV